MNIVTTTLVPQCVKYSMTDMTQKERDGLTLLLESLYKPDHKLRGCSHNQGCYEELMIWRQKVIDMLESYEKG